EYQSSLPPLPSRHKGLLHKYGTNHLEERRKGLQRWLELVMLNPKWGGSQSLTEWVVQG
ncbi:hypothetical protein IE53DRAFT_369128, partial [Violaceomyces palustris]